MTTDYWSRQSASPQVDSTRNCVLISYHLFNLPLQQLHQFDSYSSIDSTFSSTSSSKSMSMRYNGDNGQQIITVRAETGEWWQCDARGGHDDEVTSARELKTRLRNDNAEAAQRHSTDNFYCLLPIAHPLTISTCQFVVIIWQSSVKQAQKTRSDWRIVNCPTWRALLVVVICFKSNSVITAIVLRPPQFDCAGGRQN